MRHGAVHGTLQRQPKNGFQLPAFAGTSFAGMTVPVEVSVDAGMTIPWGVPGPRLNDVPDISLFAVAPAYAGAQIVPH